MNGSNESGEKMQKSEVRSAKCEVGEFEGRVESQMRH